MEKDPSIETLSLAEQAIVDLLTVHYVKGFKFKFPEQGCPILTDVSGEPLVLCEGLTLMGEDFARLNTPRNVSSLKHQNLGALYYLLTGIRLAEQKRQLYSDDYTQPGGLTAEGKGLWKQLIFLGLAEKIEQTKPFRLLIPEAETLKILHETAKTKALEIYASNQVEALIETIQNSLRQSKSGEVLE